MNLVKGLLIGALAAYTALAPTQLEARTYEVTKRDYQGLSGIAERVHVPVKEILTCNPGLTRKTILRPGMRLTVSNEHAAKSGDTLWKVADSNGVTVSDIIKYSRIRDPDAIKPGVRLEFPCRQPGFRAKQYQERAAEPESNGRTSIKPSKPYRHKTVRFLSGLELEVVNDSKLTGKGREFYDPNNSGNPLLRVPRNRLYQRVSPHFVLAEFAHIQSPSLARPEYTQRSGGDAYHTYIRLSPFLVRRLESIRRDAGQLNIRSGYRPYGYHSRLYTQVYRRQPTRLSRHMSGDGVDMDTPSRKIRRKVEAAFSGGGIGSGNDFLHVDTWNKRRWNYD